MRSSVRRLVLIGILAVLPSRVFAQEATFNGVITDSSGAVLPGVTVTALLAATGNTFVAVSDERGFYRIPVRVGTYRITAELPAFATVERPGIQILTGQTSTINMQMSPSTLQETVTVTGEAPLLRVATSSLGGNIDPTQVQEMPSEGRNWMALLLIAPGSRSTSANPAEPLETRNANRTREYQTNVDGMQFANTMGGGGQPAFSQEMIAEFQYISNRFDATQGRSSGVQVNMITKSGTNRYAGSLRGNFRDDRFNAANPVIGRVVPISNQQFAGSLGGPIMRDRLHFFGFHEYERAPKNEVWNTPFPRFNVELSGISTVRHEGGRLDYQLSPETRLMLKGNKTNTHDPFGPGNNQHPAATAVGWTISDGLVASLTKVLSNRALNETLVGYSSYLFGESNLTHWSNHWMSKGGPFGPITTGSPRITFTGFTIGGNNAAPRYRVQGLYSIKDNFTLSYDARGRHDLKTGGEFMLEEIYTSNCTQCMGVIDARNGPLPANLEQLLPDPFNVDTWNLAGISSVTRRYTLGIHKSRRTPERVWDYSAYVQDDWHPTSKLTLNLGLRYDLMWDMFQNQQEFLPIMLAGRPQNAKNLQPRFGFALQLTPVTVLRGGIGKYYGEMLSRTYPGESKTVALVEVANEGRPDFAANPFNGPPPTFEQAKATACSAPEQAANFAAWKARNYAGNPPCLLLASGEVNPPAGTYNVNNSWQSSIGFQRQFGTSMEIESDYVYTRGRNEGWGHLNLNIAFDPTTGVNYPYTDRTKLPYPEFGILAMTLQNARSAYHGVITSFTKRMSHRWQASGTYTLAGFWNAVGAPFMGVPGSTPIEVPFALAQDLKGEWGLAEGDQRHRVVLNGIWQVGRGFQLSGIHYASAGDRTATSYGGDLRNLGAGSVERQRLRPDGTIVARNAFTQPARNRTNVRVQQKIPLPSRVSIDLMAEAFNVFNRPNWTITTQEQSPQYLKRTAGENRTMQFGFRVTF
jgi:carboxypeptidase family protein/TonB-dependent receptor-like protein